MSGYFFLHKALNLLILGLRKRYGLYDRYEVCTLSFLTVICNQCQNLLEACNYAQDTQPDINNVFKVMDFLTTGIIFNRLYLTIIKN